MLHETIDETLKSDESILDTNREERPLSHFEEKNIEAEGRKIFRLMIHFEMISPNVPRSANCTMAVSIGYSVTNEMYQFIASVYNCQEFEMIKL
jgi:hypothetical protein